MKKVFLFAGGGTGGHLFPGLAIAEALGDLAPGSQAFFACSARPLDAQILTGERVEFEPIPAAPVAFSPRAFLRFIGSWGGAVRKGRTVIRKLRDRGDVHVVSMGGFVAAPVVQAARAERVPVTLVNLDAVPGKANVWIARHAGRVLTSAPVAGRAWEVVPPIVRVKALPNAGPGACRQMLNLDPATPTLLVTGASQGARSINQLIERLLETRPEVFRGWQAIHQTGAERDGTGPESVAAAYKKAGVRAEVRAFLSEMGQAWGAATLAVSRSGAGSVGEAWAARVPTLFMPYPYHKDAHQRLNALPMEAKGACVMAKDRIDPAANAGAIGPVLEALMGDEGRRAAMHAALEALGPADGASRVARALLRS